MHPAFLFIHKPCKQAVESAYKFANSSLYALLYITKTL